VWAVVATITRRSPATTRTSVWLVALAATVTSTATSSSSPGRALATNCVVIHTSGRAVTASAIAAHSAIPLPP
jgi:hypothetical protein